MDGVIVLDSWTNTTEPDISSLLLTIIIILLLLCFLTLDKRGWPILLIGIVFYIWAFSVDLQDKFGTPAEESTYYKIKLEDGVEYEEKYSNLICKMALYSLTKMGAEGETSHQENGINRVYQSANDYPDDLLNEITPLIKA